MKLIRTTGAVLLALTLISGVRAQGGPPPLDMKAVALTTTLEAAAFNPFDNLLAVAADFTAPELSVLLGAGRP